MQILIVTANEFKYRELEKYFKDVGLLTTKISEDKIKNINTNELLNENENNLFVIREVSTLLNENNEKSLLTKVEKCTHKSIITLFVYGRDNQLIEQKSYQAETDGFVFPFLRKNKDPNIFGWDDVFVSKNNNETHQQMKEKGLKISSRDIAFSLLIEDLSNHFFLKENINLNFNKVEINSVINFNFIKTLFKEDPLYQKAYQNDFFNPIINKILNDGVFLRSSRTRQQKNYWLPGVNAGIPLTPKKDRIHELTFMFHDIMHFLFPDLIITKNDDINKKIYIIYRMMGEAFTLVLADALFVHLIQKDIEDYDFNKRKIYPLFKKGITDISKVNKEEIFSLLESNAKFALLGIEDNLRNFDDSAFENYKSKYQNFFNQDYIWTNYNYHSLSRNVDINKKWYDDCKKYNLINISSTEDLSNFIKSDDTLDIFNYILDLFKRVINHAFENKDYSPLSSIKNAYKKYMAGQIMLFYRQKNNYNELFKNNILSLLNRLDNSNDMEEINLLFNEAKSCYNLYLDTLCEDKILSKYKVEQYKDIYPLFEPFFVFYDRDKPVSFYETLFDIFNDLKGRV